MMTASTARNARSMYRRSACGMYGRASPLSLLVLASLLIATRRTSPSWEAYSSMETCPAWSRSNTPFTNTTLPPGARSRSDSTSCSVATASQSSRDARPVGRAISLAVADRGVTPISAASRSPADTGTQRSRLTDTPPARTPTRRACRMDAFPPSDAITAAKVESPAPVTSTTVLPAGRREGTSVTRNRPSLALRRTAEAPCAPLVTKSTAWEEAGSRASSVDGRRSSVHAVRPPSPQSPSSTSWWSTPYSCSLPK
mmetsp:Transcript_33662/g.94713  ORF Transcript_33662/g.94713 Transcript_33662/m.94713 type:complete len:256 (+) Transcript_33662:151-918(+)